MWFFVSFLSSPQGDSCTCCGRVDFGSAGLGLGLVHNMLAAVCIWGVCWKCAPFTWKWSCETRACCSMGLLWPLRHLCFLLRLDFHRVRELPAISTVELLRPVDVTCQLQTGKGTFMYWPEAQNQDVELGSLSSRCQPQLENTAQIQGNQVNRDGWNTPQSCPCALWSLLT